MGGDWNQSTETFLLNSRSFPLLVTNVREHWKDNWRLSSETADREGCHSLDIASLVNA